jgi:plasmid stability protein
MTRSSYHRNTEKDATAALRIIAEAVAHGEIDGDHARSLIAVVEAFLKSLETVQFNERLAALDQRLSQSRTTSQTPRC